MLLFGLNGAKLYFWELHDRALNGMVWPAGGLSAGPGRGECDGFAGDEGRELGRFGFLLCVGDGEPEGEREAVAELLADADGGWSVAGAEEGSDRSRRPAVASSRSGPNSGPTDMATPARTATATASTVIRAGENRARRSLSGAAAGTVPEKLRPAVGAPPAPDGWAPSAGPGPSSGWAASQDAKSSRSSVLRAVRCQAAAVWRTAASSAARQAGSAPSSGPGECRTWSMASLARSAEAWDERQQSRAWASTAA